VVKSSCMLEFHTSVATRYSYVANSLSGGSSGSRKLCIVARSSGWILRFFWKLVHGWLRNRRLSLGTFVYVERRLFQIWPGANIEDPFTGDTLPFYFPSRLLWLRSLYWHGQRDSEKVWACSTNVLRCIIFATSRDAGPGQDYCASEVISSYGVGETWSLCVLLSETCILQRMCVGLSWELTQWFACLVGASRKIGYFTSISYSTDLMDGGCDWLLDRCAMLLIWSTVLALRLSCWSMDVTVDKYQAGR